MCRVQLFLRLARLHVNVVLYLCSMSMFVFLRKLISLKVSCLGLMLLILILNRYWTHLVVNWVVACLPTCACLWVGRLGQLLFGIRLLRGFDISFIIGCIPLSLKVVALGTQSFKLLFLTMIDPKILLTGNFRIQWK